MLTYRSTGVHTNRDSTAKGKVQARDRQGNEAETPAQVQAREAAEKQEQKQERMEAGGEAAMAAGQGLIEKGASNRDAMLNEPDPQMTRPQGSGGVGQKLLDKYVYNRKK